MFSVVREINELSKAEKSMTCNKLDPLLICNYAHRTEQFYKCPVTNVVKIY